MEGQGDRGKNRSVIMLPADQNQMLYEDIGPYRKFTFHLVSWRTPILLWLSLPQLGVMLGPQRPPYPKQQMEGLLRTHPLTGSYMLTLPFPPGPLQAEIMSTSVPLLCQPP